MSHPYARSWTRRLTQAASKALSGWLDVVRRGHDNGRQDASSAGQYTAVAIGLHWLAAILIVSALAIGVSMVDMPITPARLKLYSYHKWIGITILVLSAVRLLWRLTHRPPPSPDAVAWRRAAAHVTHCALYVIFFAIPLVGWALTSALGFPVVLFGVLPLPDFVPIDKALGELLRPWHRGLALGLGGLVALHILAAMTHRFIDGHAVLHRMGVKTRLSRRRA